MMTNYNTAKDGKLVLLCDTLDSSAVGVRRFVTHRLDHQIELVIDRLQGCLDVDELSFLKRLKLAFDVLTGSCHTTRLELSVVMDRNVAIRTNDELIDALYYDDDGVHVG